MFYGGLHRDLPWNFSDLLINLIYFEIGIHCSRFSLTLPKHVSWWSIAILSTVILVLTYQIGINQNSIYRPITAIAGIVASMAISQCIVKSQSWIRSFLEYCGRHTLQIFTTHIIATAGIRIILQKLEVHSIPLYFLAGMIAGLLLPFCITKVDEHLKLRLFRLQ